MTRSVGTADHARSGNARTSNAWTAAIVEGIETLHQLNRLKELGCTRGQGFYLGKPMSTAKIAGLLPTTPEVALDGQPAAEAGPELRVVG